MSGAGDHSDSEESSTLPKTGETQNIFTHLIGIVATSIGGLLLAWNKKRENLSNIFKKN